MTFPESVDVYECHNPDCGFTGPPRVVDYYGVDMDVCRLCGWELEGTDD